MFPKSSFYSSFSAHGSSIVSERDPENHREMHKYLAPAFSDRSLKEQEPLIAEIIDRFFQHLQESSEKSVDLTKHFKLLTFDIIGELAFGKSFHGIETSYEHPWVAVVMASIRQSSLADTFRRLPILGLLYVLFNPRWLKALVEGAANNMKYAREAVEQ